VLSPLETSVSDIVTTMNTAATTPSTSDLLKLQMASSQYFAAVDLGATLAKSMEDAMKGIVQKVG
jgi:hypothetical protein